MKQAEHTKQHETVKTKWTKQVLTKQMKTKKQQQQQKKKPYESKHKWINLD